MRHVRAGEIPVPYIMASGLIRKTRVSLGEMEVLFMEITCDIRRAEEAQKRLCEERGVPFFVPPGGVCPRCGRNVYTRECVCSRIGARNLSVNLEVVDAELITGCPFCHVSFVE